jgi:plastocyanin
VRRVAALTAAAVVAVAAGGGVASAGSRITLKDDKFSPTSLTVAKGAAVTIVWSGKHPHNVVGGGVKTAIKSSGSQVVRFKKKGSFTLVCQVHPGMKMKLKVK